MGFEIIENNRETIIENIIEYYKEDKQYELYIKGSKRLKNWLKNQNCSEYRLIEINKAIGNAYEERVNLGADDINKEILLDDALKYYIEYEYKIENLHKELIKIVEQQAKDKVENIDDRYIQISEEIKNIT